MVKRKSSANGLEMLPLVHSIEDQCKLELIIQITIIHQTQDFLVVEKPPGLSVHNIEDPQNLLALLAKQIDVAKLFPVHRLDKETSGVQILALNSVSAKKLSDEFLNKRVKKSYVGVLRGQLKKAEGVWTKKLTDKAEGQKNPQGLSAARVPCETRYQVLQSSKYFSWCQFDLITGRQHQIRKHTSLEKHSLVGDPRYGDKKYNKKIFSLYETKRMFLHSQKVEILGMIFESPTPNEFAALFKQ